ncbi:e3 ubiquitin-protein ligase NEURL1 [Trichonephila clavipes]|nr:e3 ubiquitin-protein ligase NEURL1 [Trichonephila clavipes]
MLKTLVTNYDPNTLNPEYISDSSHNNGILTRNEIQNSKARHFQINQLLCFHGIHGKNVSLDSTRTLASRKQWSNSLAYVFTECCLKLEEKVVVQISRTNPKYNGSLLYGITSCNPSTLNPNLLPENADDLLDRPEYWIVRNDSNSYEVGDTVVYSISTEGEVIVMINSEYKSSKFHVDPTQPLWLFFNLIGSVSEISLIGSSVSDTSGSDIANHLEGMKVSLPENSSGKPGTSGQHTCNECVICFGEQVDCAIYRCGHMCMCYTCASKLKNSANDQCPICREVIEDVIRVYR